LENIDRLMIRSLQNLSSYRYTETDESSTAYQSNASELRLSSSSSENEDGYLNFLDKAAWLNLTSVWVDCGGDESMRLAETYLLDGHLYVSENGQWSRFAVSDPDKVLMEMDKLGSLVDIISNSEKALLENESAEGQDYYVLRLVPDEGASLQILKPLASDALSCSLLAIPPADERLMQGENGLFQNSQMVWTVWISTSDFLPRRVEGEIRLQLPSSLLQAPPEAQDLNVEIYQKSNTLFFGFDEPYAISLPAEAMAAKEEA